MKANTNNTKNDTHEKIARDRIETIVSTGLMTALVAVVTMVIPIPVPFTGGYIHLGDSMIFLSVLILGFKYGAFSAGVGSAIADLLIYPSWAPFTLVIKGLMALVMGFIMYKCKQKNMRPVFVRLFGMIASGLFMIVGYFFAGGIILGGGTAGFATAALSIPFNIIQFVAGVVIGMALAQILAKTRIGSKFE